MAMNRSAVSGVEVAGEAERVRHRFLAGCSSPASIDSRSTADSSGERAATSRRATLTPSGKRQPGLEQPPLTEVEHLDEPFVRVGQLPLVDQQARRRRAPT